MHPIYLDYNATTPIDSEVVEFMLPFLKENFGNPSSMHKFGTESRLALGEAREKVASLLECSRSEIIFTSGGTESNNIAIRGIAHARKELGNHIITSQIEHPAVLEVCKNLEREGFEITYLSVGKEGKINLHELQKNIRPSTILVSIMHANNESGIIQPVKSISEITRKRGIIFHSDAAQSAGKIPVNVKDTGIDLLSLAAHKFYGPKGIGALYIKNGIRLEKILFGANHEKNLRPGTENLLEIAGMAKAAEIAKRDLEKNARNMRLTRDRLYEIMKKEIPECRRNGDPACCLPNTLSISIPGLDAGALLAGIPEIGISSGAACHADEVHISHVLEAMQVPQEYALGTLRISTGKATTMEEVEKAATLITDKIKQIISPDNVRLSNLQEPQVKLTKYTHGMGCACKLSPRLLEEVLSSAKIPENPDILVGKESSDDAAVYKLNDNSAIVQTVDFFTPVVDDPWEFGAITAANALSDIYAMGGIPLFALNIVAFPPHRLPLQVLKEILKGAEEVAEEAGVAIIGGHSIEDNEPKYGLVVTGTIHPDKILRNKGASQKDAVILTKRLGTGILSTALKRGLLSRRDQISLFNSMRLLNKKTSEIILNYPVTSCTDVSGFGLLGHLKEVCIASDVSAEINHSDLLFLPQAEEFSAEGLIPGGTENNLKYLKPHLEISPTVPDHLIYLAADAQTSGGLLFTINEKYAISIMKDLTQNEIECARIGTILPSSKMTIYLK
ncbi:MAG: selenide, water dikinase SelD [Bacteroidota bacterium]